jgi:hypothetical protein
MRKRFVGAILAAAFLTTAPAALAQGVTFGIGGGWLPYLEEGAGSDFGVTGLVAFGGGEDLPVSFRLDATYVPSSDFADYAMFLGNVVYTFKTSAESRFHPYLLGGGGIIVNFVTDDTDIDFGIGGGAGFDYQTTGSIRPFAEARFINEFVTGGSFQFMHILAGVKFAPRS